MMWPASYTGSQRWVQRPGTRQQDDEQELSPTWDGLPAVKPVRVPLYLFCLDLAFAAAFNVCAQCLSLSKQEDDDTALRFFMIFLPVAWLWDHTNRFFNRFDQEDLVSEFAVAALMGCTMALAMNTRACFFPDLVGTEEPTDSSCAFFVSTYGVVRAVLTALTLRVSIYVPAARRLLCRELLLWLFLAPLCAA